MTLPAYLTTAEAAEYLRLKERKVYDLVSQGVIPCVRVTGKLLFPRQRIDLWLMNHLEGDDAVSSPTPPVLAGSQDPLLEWAVKESGAELALLCQGSGDGVQRLIAGRAMLAGMHIWHAESRGYNDPVTLGLSGMRDLVLIRWAKRQQGLLLAADNPHRLARLEDIARPGIRLAHRQPDAGVSHLLQSLLARHRLDARNLTWATHPSLSEDDLALAIRQGEADVGVGIEAAARRQGLAFIPLQQEHFDLAMRRRHYFDPAMQRLLAFAGSERFVQRAEALGGYDIAELGHVVYNA
ncbi:helix-turn-helix transcriptional regulator [Marinobacter salarius]|jgi:excisionase family DNA binding protein|uniref:helix-turn-helix transcriptional regulator n=1 Tax=Marinobacter salarius TaxID=1420917 RepID=UPI0010AABA3B|nr:MULTISPECIES: helix-turn-helix transcriptional regulator [Marinobacter]MBJ7300997.1 helix-turn-helix transcriptional regulator [Marinobacter salarius]HIO30145.1 helix-turn-helix domain-containing protein [Marinobacter salarius]HIO99150.1 helix-turn-helix domain-containing protein [Marinobacter salarius]